MTNQPIQVLVYDGAWPARFRELHDLIWPAVQAHALRIEHVGSTSVPGLAAKPIIDMTIVVSSEEAIAPAIEKLEQIGYQHRGDLGVVGREAFFAPQGLHRHNLYLCVEGTQPLRNHIGVRDLLRGDPEAMQAYGDLKIRLAKQHPNDIDAYIAAKTPMLLELLSRVGVSEQERSTIESINTKPARKEA